MEQLQLLAYEVAVVDAGQGVVDRELEGVLTFAGEPIACAAEVVGDERGGEERRRAREFAPQQDRAAAGGRSGRVVHDDRDGRKAAQSRPKSRPPHHPAATIGTRYTKPKRASGFVLKSAHAIAPMMRRHAARNTRERIRRGWPGVTCGGIRRSDESGRSLPTGVERARAGPTPPSPRATVPRRSTRA